MPDPALAVAYLAQNRIHVRLADGTENVVESRYGEKVRQRATQIERRHAWKTQGRGAQFMGGAMLWGGDNDTTQAPALVTGIARGRRPGELVYSLRADAVSGVFAVDLKSGEEERVYHGADRSIEDVATSSEGVIAFSTRHKNGSASIAVMATDGSQVAIVTEGDSLDVAPRWIPDAPRQLVFQSTGIGRDEVGRFAALGHATVALLDPESGGLKPIATDATFDYLAPQLAADGSLYCLRRAHAEPARAVNPFRAILDILLFPFRILWAIARFLDFFTMRHTGKPLITSGPARQRAQDLQKMVARGHLMEAQDAARRSAERDEEEVSAGPSHDLICKRPDGTERAIASSVLAFDVGRDGTIVYASGRALWIVEPTGKKTRVCDAERVERVVLLEE